MRMLFRVGCLGALAILASCGGDASSTSSSSSAASAPAPQAQPQQAIKLSTDPTGLVPVRTAKGVMVKLDDQFQNGILARRNADGSLAVECHDDQQAATAFMQGATPAPSEVK
jgi:hypothetical protein